MIANAISADMPLAPRMNEIGGRAVRSALAGDVVLATDGSDLAANAARVARAIARRHDRHVVAVQAVETHGVAIPPPLDVAVALADDYVGPSMHAAQEDDVRAALSTALGAPIDWPVRIGLGAAASVIGHEARDSNAGLIVLGLNRHAGLDRALHDETALRVARECTTPVLAVAPCLHELPRHVVAAVDFSDASHAAARLARTLVAPGGTLTLVYVEWTFHDDEGERRVHALGVRTALAMLRDELDRDDDVVVQTAVIGATVQRPVAEQLVEHARRIGGEMIAVGTRHRGAVERWLLGSVATGVVRDGRLSVLAVPPVVRDHR